MSTRIQLLCNGIDQAVHLRWAFDPDLGFPDGGFNIYRRRSRGDGKWHRLAYAKATDANQLTSNGHIIRWSPQSATGAEPSLAPVGSVVALTWADGEFAFQIVPSAPRLAIVVGLVPGAPVAPIRIRAVSVSGVETQQIAPAAGTAERVEFASADVSEVRIEGVGVFVTAFDVMLFGSVVNTWGDPLNGLEPIRLPRSATRERFLTDIAVRLSPLETATILDLADAAAVEELRLLVEACQSNPVAAPGPPWITLADANGSTSVDPRGLLLMLALRPIVARGLGLYWIDKTALAGEVYDYRVEGMWGSRAPIWASVGTLAHEFYGASSAITQFPSAISTLAAAAVEVPVANPKSAPVRPIFVRMAATDLNWTVPNRSGTDLIDYDSVLYWVDRQALGLLDPPTAQPPTPNANAWATINEDFPQCVVPDDDGTIVDPMLCDAPIAVDSPLEGWYAYRVRGASIFGLSRGNSPSVNVLLLDVIAPSRPRLVEGPAGTRSIADDVPLSWAWGPDEALAAPDTTTFRIYAQERAPTTLTVTTGAVSVDAVNGRATVPLAGGPLPIDASTRLPGSRVEVGGRAYLILAATAGGVQSIETALANGAGPPSNAPGTISYVIPPGEEWNSRVMTVNPTPAVDGALSAAARAAGLVTATLTPAGAIAAATRGASVYDRTNGFTFLVDGPPNAAGLVALIPPTTFGATDPLPNGQVIVFPRQTATVAAPYAVGAPLRYSYVAVSAADGRAYRPDRLTSGAHSGMAGNESAPSLPASLLVIDPTPPVAPAAGTNPDGPNVYATPPDFYGRSYYKLPLVETPGIRFEVYRALDRAVFAADAARQGARAFQDGQYAALTNRQLADLAANFDDVFMLRTTAAVVGSSFVDELPGGAPNRFLYRLRSVNEAGVRSPFSAPLAPVWIPDTIPPSAPSLKNTTVANGGLTLRWTQPNARLVTQYHVYRTTDGAQAVDVRLMGPPRVALPAALRQVGAIQEYDDSDVADGVRYWYRVTAVRHVAAPLVLDLESVPSGAIMTKAVNFSPPKPAVITASVWNAAPRQVALSWTQSPGVRAIIERTFDNLSWRVAASLQFGVVSYVDDLSLEPGRVRARYRIRTFTANGRSTQSAPVDVLLS
jgi:hypothetical protein